MYGGAVSVPIVVRSMIGKSWGQGAQHSQGLHSMFMHVPGLKVVSPSNAYDAKGCMISAIRDNNPVIFVEHRLLYPLEAYVPEEPYTVEFGRARICTPGDDITIVGISNMLVESLRAQELLLDAGIKAEVIDPISLVPLDMETIINSANRTRRLLVVDNAWTNCGASAEILARAAESADGRKVIQMARMGFAPTTCPPSPPLEHEYYPNPAKIAAKAYSMVHGSPGNWTPDPERAALSYQLQFRGPF
jgi:pyruvate dehydrogenase E1 component beta subunit